MDNLSATHKIHKENLQQPFSKTLNLTEYINRITAQGLNIHQYEEKYFI